MARLPRGWGCHRSNGGGDHLLFIPDEGGAALQEAVFVFDHETSKLKVVVDEFPGEQTDKTDPVDPWFNWVRFRQPVGGSDDDLQADALGVVRELLRLCGRG